MTIRPNVVRVQPPELPASPDVLMGRTNPRLPEDELRRALECVRTLVGEQFLRAPGWHPLRELWKRGDHVATGELFWLGSCMLAVDAADHDWVMHMVERIKLPQHARTNRTGSMFEILALGSLAIGGHRVVPAADSMPGYDGSIVLDDGSEVRISLKNFGPTDNQILFERQSRVTRDYVLQLVGRSTWIGLRIDADVFPKLADWHFLRMALPYFLDHATPIGRIAGIWRVQILPHATTPHGLAFGFTSYTVIITAPRGQAEAGGFRRKIVGALRNLENNAVNFPAAASAVVIAKVSAAASMSDCAAAARRFLDTPGVRTSHVFLYQSTVVGNPESREDAIHHNLTAVRGAGSTVSFQLNFSMPVGLVSNEPSHLELRSDNAVEDLSGKPVYFDSQLYEAYPTDEHGHGSASSWTLSPGQAHIGVLRSRSGEEMAFEPRYPPRQDLALFL